MEEVAIIIKLIVYGACPNSSWVGHNFNDREGTLLDLQRQYSDYLSLSEEDLAEFELPKASTPLHNIAAEQEVGMVSAAQKRAPGATMLYLRSQIKATRNKTLPF